MVITARLESLISQSHNTPYAVNLAQQHLESIHAHSRFLHSSGYSVALVGQKGVGKSSLLAVLTDLIIGECPKDADQMAERCVPAVGAGGTTVCEVRVRPSTAADGPAPEGMHYGIVIEPRSVEDVEREIEIFALTEVVRVRGADGQTTRANDLQDSEIARAIRGLTGSVQVPMRDAAGRFQGLTDPLEDMIVNRIHGNDHRLAQVLKEMARLDSRTKTQWWFGGPRDKALKNVKELFIRLNNGTEPDATLPHRITIWAHPTGQMDFGGLEVSFVDTRGFDGNLEARGDLQSVLQDERTLILVCVSFTDHANDMIRGFLRDVKRLRFLNVSHERVRIVIIDKGEAQREAAANGIRDVGQFLKKQACERTLVNNGLEDLVHMNEEPAFVSVFDNVRDDSTQMASLIRTSFERVRTAKRDSLERAEAQAVAFLDNIHDEVQTRARMAIDRRLAQVFNAARPQNAFLPHCVTGLVELVESNRRFASRVAAMCRRMGEYDTLNAYDAVHTFVQQSFDEYCGPVDVTINATFRALEQDAEFSDVVGHIGEKRDVYERRKAKLRAEFATAVRNAVRAEMRRGGVWQTAANRWGGGPGFLDDVVRIFEDWSTTNKTNLPSQDPFRPVDFGLTELSE